MENTSPSQKALFTGGPSLYAVSLDTAQQSVAMFQHVMTSATKAFTVHAGDFLGALGFTQDQIDEICEKYPLPYDYARMYLGLTDPEKQEMRVFMVPVKGAEIDEDKQVAGEDIIPEGQYHAYKQSEIHEGKFVYDLIAPCPGTCDTSSPLYYLQGGGPGNGHGGHGHHGHHGHGHNG